jgi:cardiolipin synthase
LSRQLLELPYPLPGQMSQPPPTTNNNSAVSSRFYQLCNSKHIATPPAVFTIVPLKGINIASNICVKLILHPGDGVKPLVQAIDEAKERLEIAVFRFDRSELEKAITRAVGRGVFVHALIAYTNRGGEKNLRQLEMRLLEHGVNVARTADDLVRYHGKYMIVDREELFVLGFNFTYLDMEHSRSFGLVTRNPKLVKEAVKLFEADTTRQPYEAGSDEFIVSPVNARERLSAFISGAKKELIVYDPKVADPRIIRLLEDRAKAGVEIRIIGSCRGATGWFPVNWPI